MELNGLLSKFFCYITWLLYQLIRRDTGRLANEDFASNPIVPWKQLNGLKITNWFCYITWLDATVDDLQTRSLRQILLSLRNNGLTNGLKNTNWSQKKSFIIQWQKLLIFLRIPLLHFIKSLLTHRMHPLFPSLCRRGGWASDQIFKKGRGVLDRISIFREGCWVRGGNFFQGEDCSFYIKNKRKSETFSDIWIYKPKYFSLS